MGTMVYAREQRNKITPTTIGLFLNVAAIIWAAATFVAKLDQLQGQMVQQAVVMDKFATFVQDLRERVRVLEDHDQRSGNRTQSAQP